MNVRISYHISISLLTKKKIKRNVCNKWLIMSAISFYWNWKKSLYDEKSTILEIALLYWQHFTYSTHPSNEIFVRICFFTIVTTLLALMVLQILSFKRLSTPCFWLWYCSIFFLLRYHETEHYHWQYLNFLYINICPFFISKILKWAKETVLKYHW